MNYVDPVFAVARALTDEERHLIVDRFVSWNPRWDGAEAADILDTLNEAAAYLDKTEPFFDEHEYALPDVAGIGCVMMAIVAMGRKLTVPAVLDMLQRAGLVTAGAEAGNE